MDSEFPKHQLYYFASCPYCIKAITQLTLMGFKLPLRNIKRHPEYKLALVQGGGKKQVPCLRIEHENGDVDWMYESSDIVRYFKQQVAHT